MTDVTPYPKDRGECGCGCGRTGTYRRRAWSNGVRCVRACEACKQCKGKRARSRGDSQASKVRRFVGAKGAATRHEEGWGGALRIEVKAGANDTGPILTRYLAAKAQSEAARPVGDHRPFVHAVAPVKGPRLYVIEEEELPQVVAAFAENWGATG